MEQNGFGPEVKEALAGPQPPPHLIVVWNAESQDVELRIPNGVFRTPEFIVAMLEMAKSKAEHLRNLERIKQMHHAEVKALQDQQKAALAAREIQNLTKQLHR